MCEPFIRLAKSTISCGTINSTTKERQYSKYGTAQGNVASPVLANIVLDKLDKYMTKYKRNFETGRKRSPNKKYISLPPRTFREAKAS